MNHKYIPILRNPINHEPVDFRETAEGAALVGRNSGTHFRVREGIPVFIDPAGLTEANEKSRIYYDILSPFYGFTQSLYYRLKGGEEQSRNEYLKHAGVREGDMVLEVSVGNGANIRFLPRNADYFGIDVSWGQLKRCIDNANEYKLNIELFQAEAEHLPFCDGTFDVIFNVGSMSYFEDKKKAIDEMFRVAKPGARMMIADETERSARAHNRLPIYRGFFNGKRDPVTPPIALVPQEAVEVEQDEIRDGAYYCLRFRKKGPD